MSLASALVNRLGPLLCRLGRHDRRQMPYHERGVIRRPDGPTESYDYRLVAYRCVRCEPPPTDITNDPILMPRLTDQRSGKP